MHINLDIVRSDEFPILIDVLISLKYFSENKAERSKEINNLLEQFDNDIFLVSARNEDSQIIAFMGIEGDCLAFLYVWPKYRNKGIATIMLRDALENFDLSTAYVPKDDIISYHLYSKFGFFIANDDYKHSFQLLKHIYKHTIEINKDLSLRYVSYDDANDIFNTIDSQRDYLGVWLSFIERTRKVHHTDAFIDSAKNISGCNKAYIFSIRYKNQFAGIVGLSNVDLINRRAEIGCWLSQDFLGKGIATMSVKAIEQFAFTKLQLNRIQVKTAIGNARSRKIPERLGYQFEGIERSGELLTGNRFVDMEVFSKLASD